MTLWKSVHLCTLDGMTRLRYLTFDLNTVIARPKFTLVNKV
jgi:hypothetical protein